MKKSRLYFLDSNITDLKFGKMTSLSVNRTNMEEISKDLTKCVLDYDLLCLSRSQKWCAELLFSISDTTTVTLTAPEVARVEAIQIESKDFARFQLARSYFAQKEYQRAAFYLQDFQSESGFFLCVYAKYMVKLTQLQFVTKSYFLFFI